MGLLYHALTCNPITAMLTNIFFFYWRYNPHCGLYFAAL